MEYERISEYIYIYTYIYHASLIYFIYDNTFSYIVSVLPMLYIASRENATATIVKTTLRMSRTEGRRLNTRSREIQWPFVQKLLVMIQWQKILLVESKVIIKGVIARNRIV